MIASRRRLVKPGVFVLFERSTEDDQLIFGLIIHRDNTLVTTLSMYEESPGEATMHLNTIALADGDHIMWDGRGARVHEYRRYLTVLLGASAQ